MWRGTWLYVLQTEAGVERMRVYLTKYLSVQEYVEAERAFGDFHRKAGIIVSCIRAAEKRRPEGKGRRCTRNHQIFLLHGPPLGCQARSPISVVLAPFFLVFRALCRVWTKIFYPRCAYKYFPECASGMGEFSSQPRGSYSLGMYIAAIAEGVRRRQLYRYGY